MHPKFEKLRMRKKQLLHSSYIYKTNASKAWKAAYDKKQLLHSSYTEKAAIYITAKQLLHSRITQGTTKEMKMQLQVLDVWIFQWLLNL